MGAPVPHSDGSVNRNIMPTIKTNNNPFSILNTTRLVFDDFGESLRKACGRPTHLGAPVPHSNESIHRNIVVSAIKQPTTHFYYQHHSTCFDDFGEALRKACGRPTWAPLFHIPMSPFIETLSCQQSNSQQPISIINTTRLVLMILEKL